MARNHLKGTNKPPFFSFSNNRGRILNNRKDSITDYLAAGIINFAGVFFWIQIVNMFQSTGLRIFSYIVYVLTGVLSNYLFFRKRGEVTQIKLATTIIISWLISVVMLVTIIQTESLAFYPVLLLCFGFGGLIGSRIVMQEKEKAERQQTKEDS
jgi:hypothetical protein